MPLTFCPSCGTRRWNDARFCGSCGHDFEAAARAEPAAPEPEAPPPSPPLLAEVPPPLSGPAPVLGSTRATPPEAAPEAQPPVRSIPAEAPSAPPGPQPMLQPSQVAPPSVEPETLPPSAMLPVEIPPPPAGPAPVLESTDVALPAQHDLPRTRSDPGRKSNGQPEWLLPFVAVLALVVVLVGGALVWLRLQPAASPATSVRPEPSLMAVGVATPGAPSATTAAAPPALPGAITPRTSASLPLAWQPTAPLAQARWGAGSAALADGRVLVVGGTTTTSSSGAIASAELYDPTNGSWQTVTPPHTARAYPVVVALADGRVLVAGGARDKSPLTSSELFNPATGSWSTGPAMTTPRSDFAGVRLADGSVLVVGGATTRTAGPATRSAEIYDPAANRWTATAPMHVARAYPTATLLPDGRVLVVGGTTTFAQSGQVLASAELFDPSSGTWTDTGPMVVPAYGHSAARLPNGDVLVVGGWSSTDASARAIATAQLYDPRSNTWSATSPMGTARADARLLLLRDGRALVVGGLSASYGALASVEAYDSATTAWSTLPSTAVAEWWGTLALLPSGNVLLAGGSGDSVGRSPLRDAEVLSLAGVVP